MSSVSGADYIKASCRQEGGEVWEEHHQERDCSRNYCQEGQRLPCRSHSSWVLHIRCHWIMYVSSFLMFIDIPWHLLLNSSWSHIDTSKPWIVKLVAFNWNTCQSLVCSCYVYMLGLKIPCSCLCWVAQYLHCRIVAYVCCVYSISACSYLYSFLHILCRLLTEFLSLFL